MSQTPDHSQRRSHAKPLAVQDQCSKGRAHCIDWKTGYFSPFYHEREMIHPYYAPCL